MYECFSVQSACTFHLYITIAKLLVHGNPKRSTNLINVNTEVRRKKQEASIHKQSRNANTLDNFEYAPNNGRYTFAIANRLS